MNGRPPVAIRDLGKGELPSAAALLGRGMRDNPLHVAAFGSDPAHREIALSRFFLPVLRGIAGKGRILCACRGEALVGVCAMTPPGRCQPTLLEKLRIIPALVMGNRPHTLGAVLQWTGSWARNDPDASHWHLGPVAVDRDLQGQGVGRILLASFVRAMDEAGGLAYLETDKRENVPFYEKHGFVVTGREPVLAVPNWYMERRAGSGTS